MRNNYDEEFLEKMQELTGLTGDELYCLTGAVFATAFLGKMPTNDDLVAYLGVSRRTVSDTLRGAVTTGLGLKGESRPLARWFVNHLMFTGPSPVVTQVVYPLATEMLTRGLYLESDEEPLERIIARIFLQTMFLPQTVQTLDAFIGFNVVLEYLWTVVAGSCDSIDEFISVRFEIYNRIPEKVQAFCDLIYKQNDHLKKLRSPSMFFICEYLADGVRRARNQAMRNGSAKIAKERLSKLLDDVG